MDSIGYSGNNACTCGKRWDARLSAITTLGEWCCLVLHGASQAQLGDFCNRRSKARRLFLFVFDERFQRVQWLLL
jgi:hypothetical protein